MKTFYPWVFWLIPVYLILVAAGFYFMKSRKIPLATLSFSKPRSTWRTIAVRSGRFLLVAAAVLLFCGLAGPWQADVTKLVLPSGIQIMVALDVSGSMAAEDFQPENRLAAAKDVLRDFIRGRPSDSIGLILFAGQSVTRSPLTLRHDPLLKTLEKVEMGNLPDGTSIGSAILSGINRLSAQTAGKRGDRILLLITDGRNNAGEVHPYDALSIAVQKKIRIYTIGVGGYGDVPFPVVAPNGKKTYRYEKADLDEAMLNKIADRTGGKYFRAADPKSLGLLFAQINLLEKSEAQSIETETVRNRTELFLLPAALLSLCYFGLQVWIRRMP